MPEDNEGEDSEAELGETADRLGGIASRLQNESDTETTETTEATGSTETIDTTKTTEMTGTTKTTEATDSTETIETTEATKTTEAVETSETTNATPQPGDEDFDLKEHWNGRTVYLSDELIGEIEAMSGQLQAEFRKAYGRALKMNRDFYPAVFRAALHDTSLREELDLDE
ncbi:hypothetical protein [Halobacterium salinarum]|uniref:hypothetical protein n=1 Tax=Halobacterium salinarum TaxID=2242 RepID=UPI0030CA138E